MAEILSNIERIRRSREDIRQQEKDLIILSDVSKVETVHEWFDQLLQTCSNPPHPGTVQYRQLFIFIIFLLYAPGSLFGDKMPRGLRHELAKVLKVKSDQRISDNSVNVRFLYTTYADFKKHADYLYSEIIFKIEFSKT